MVGVEKVAGIRGRSLDLVRRGARVAVVQCGADHAVAHRHTRVGPRAAVPVARFRALGAARERRATLARPPGRALGARGARGVALARKLT